VRPNQAEGRWAEEKSGKNFADGERLAETFAEAPENPGDGDDDHPLRQHQPEVSFDGGRIHCVAKIACELKLEQGEREKNGEFQGRLCRVRFDTV